MLGFIDSGADPSAESFSGLSTADIENLSHSTAHYWSQCPERCTHCGTWRHNIEHCVDFRPGQGGKPWHFPQIDQRNWRYPKTFKTTPQDIRAGRTTCFGPINPAASSSSATIAPAPPPPAPAPAPASAPGPVVNPPLLSPVVIAATTRESLPEPGSKAPKGTGRYSAVPPPSLNAYDKKLLPEQVEAQGVEDPGMPGRGLWPTYPNYREWSDNVGLEWKSRSELRQDIAQEAAAVREEQRNESPENPLPGQQMVSFLVRNNDQREPYSLDIGGFGARRILRMGWLPGRGLGRHENVISVPVQQPSALGVKLPS